MKILSILVLCVCIISACCVEKDDVDPVIKIENGKIRGRRVLNLHNGTFYAFLEVPYASPPVGELRFKEAIPPQDWQGILNTTENTKICMETYPNKTQSKLRESEDCLYANVYIPKLPQPNDESLPVMVYIYGGQFAYNDGTFGRYNPQLFVESGVITVIFNYRQGQLGFLTTGDGVIPGNLGLKDQVRALEWVQSNIHNFGGDPSKVTIMGQSSGAICVAFHVLSPRSAGLFRGAIIQSGSTIMTSAVILDPKYYAYELGKQISPDFTHKNSSEDLLRLLKSVPADEICQIVPFLPGSTFFSTVFRMRWGPVIENATDDKPFIIGPMHDNIRDGNFLRVPVLMGVTSEEILWYIEQDKMAKWGPYLDKTPLEIIRDNIPVKKELRTEFAKKLRSIYTNTSFTSEGIVPLFRFLSDVAFRVPVTRHADMQSKYEDVYFYEFAYYGPRSETKGHTHPVNHEGMGSAAHAEDINYLLHIHNDDELKFPESDILMSHRMIKMWTNFIKYSNPTPEQDPLLQNVIWPKLPRNDFVYLNINKNLTVLQGYPREYAKWLPLIDKYYDHPLITL